MQRLYYSIQILNSRHVMQLLDVDIRQAQRVMQQVRNYFNKKKRQPVTMDEFCQFTGFSVEAACAKLGWPWYSESITKNS